LVTISVVNGSTVIGPCISSAAIGRRIVITVVLRLRGLWIAAWFAFHVLFPCVNRSHLVEVHSLIYLMIDRVRDFFPSFSFVLYQ